MGDGIVFITSQFRLFRMSLFVFVSPDSIDIHFSSDPSVSGGFEIILKHLH